MKWYTVAKEDTINIKKKKKYRDVYILDEIGGYGVYAKNFIRELSEIDSDIINLHIDSAGGNITDGIAIYNALRAHPAQVDVYINGIAASIASIIILAGDNVYIPENAGIFTHLPMLGALDMPNRKDLEDAESILGRFESVLANIYMKHTGADLETVSQWMENDTWFFGQEAVEAGFATEVVDKVAIAARMKDLEKYAFYASLPDTEVSEEQKTDNEVTTMKEEVEVVDSVEEVAVEAPEATEEAVEDSSPAPEVSAEVEESTEVEEVEEVAEEEELVEEALAYEQERKEGILAVSEKYNKDGLLDAEVIKALASDISVSEFKDIVLDVFAKAPSSKKVEKQIKNKDSEVEEIRAQIAESKSPVEKAVLARKLRELR